MGPSKQSSIASECKYFCSEPDCGQTFTRLKNLQRHRKVHEKKKEVELKYRCDVDGCEKVFRKRKQLYDHKFMIHDQERKQQYSCSHCSAKFVTSTRLNIHMKKHNGYQCADCDFLAETWSALRRHKALSHPVEHQCDRCEKKFSKPNILKKHQRVHEMAIACPEPDCGVKVLPQNMAKHVKIAHAKSILDGRQVQQIDDLISASSRDSFPPTPRDYECSECGKKFAKERNLRMHKRSVHEKRSGGDKDKKRSRRFPCTVDGCQCQFSTQVKLQGHLNWHQGLQPYQCPEGGCVAKFATELGLQRHVKWKHMKLLREYDLGKALASMCQSQKDEGIETDSSGDIDEVAVVG